MAKRYIKANIPVDTWQRLKDKNSRMNSNLKDLGIRRRVPLTRMIDAISKKQLWFEHQELVKIAGVRRLKI